MLTKITTIKPSLIKNAGMGCFLEEPIKKGETLLIFNPRFDLLFTEIEIENFDAATKQFIKHYGYLDQQQFKGYWVLHTGNDRFINHSLDPTIIPICVKGSQYIMIATKDLQIGDEITNNYNEYETRFL